jgi:hypothetical protein
MQFSGAVVGDLHLVWNREAVEVCGRGALPGSLRSVDIWSVAPMDSRDLLREERGDLLELLGSLTAKQWLMPTACQRWSVKDVALHLLDDDLGWLSRGRDTDSSGLIPMQPDYRRFVAALDQKNQRWVDAATGLSRRVVTDLLGWSGDQVAIYHAGLGLTDGARVVWAGGEVPVWLGLGRDLTERWVHQKQIREAVDRPGHHDRYLPTVLATFVWAFPYQYRPEAQTGTVVNLDLGEDATWHLVRTDGGWQLEPGLQGPAAAALTTDSDTAWRQLTGAAVSAKTLLTEGPRSLADPLLDVRGIIV